MKTKKTLILFATLLLMLAFGCKKEDPIEVKNTAQPVFTFNGTLNGSATSLQAGINNYYMYTSYTQDANGVYGFIGDLKTYNCSSCNNSLQIQVNDYQNLASGASANIGVALQPAYYAYQIPGGTPTQYPINFTSFSFNVAPVSWAWDFGDGTTSTLQSPVHTYMHPGDYTICLTTTFADLTTNSSCNPIHLGTPQAGCTGNYTYTASGNTLTFNPSSFGTAPFTYLWDFGDGTTSTLMSPSHTYASAGLYTVSLNVTDAAGHLLTYNRNCATQGYTGSIAGFYFLGSSTANPNLLSNVVVNWTDASGLVYTSNNASQPSTSYFKVLSVDSYENNQAGQTTKKVHASVNCVLYNGTSTIQLTNGDVVFGFAYH